MKWLLIVMALGMVGLNIGCAGPSTPRTVDHVNLTRYAGKWYEIARFPTDGEAGCVGSTVEYTPVSDDTLRVVNRCYEGTVDGPARTVRGTARVVDSRTNAKLLVTFTPATSRDDWILQVTDDYQNVLLGTPDREDLRILSRGPRIDPQVLQAFYTTAKEQGFDIQHLRFTPQPPTDSEPASGAPARVPAGP